MTLNDAWLFTDSFIKTLRHYLRMIILQMEENKLKNWWLAQVTLLVGSKTAARIYSFAFQPVLVPLHSLFLCWTEKLKTFPVSNREPLKIWSFKEVAGCILFYYKVSASLSHFATLTSLFQRHLFFHLGVTKLLPHTINPPLAFPCSCVSWQLWITSSVKMWES